MKRMELESELRRAIQNLKLYSSDQDLGGRTSISLGSGCDLFMKYVTRTFTLEDMVDFLVPCLISHKIKVSFNIHRNLEHVKRSC